ncbi:MAG: T6SS immunity protein Tli4 family protein [Propionivibrio sp.]
MMTPEENQRIEALTQRMTSRCVGRYLIDLPDDFVLNPIHRTVLEGVEISIEPMAYHRFNKALRVRHEALKNERLMGEDTPSLTAVMPLSDEAGYVFNRSRNQSSKVLRKLELIAFRDDHKIEMMVDARDMAQAEQIRENDTRRTDVQEKLAHLLKIYSRVRGRADHEVPAEPGVCFANGFLQGAPTDAEQVDLNYHLNSAEDVYFAFHSLSDLQQDDELLDRGPAIERMLEESSGHTLRKGPVKGPIASAQEWLMSKTSSDSGLLYQHFTQEANAKTGSAATPVLVLDMNAGIPIPGPALSLEEAAVRKPLSRTTFSEAQAVALWDKTAPTLRPRPVSGPASPVKPVTVMPSEMDEAAPSAAPAQAAAPQFPLGTAAASLQYCPQSGLWECSAKPAIGDRRRYFLAGWTFPSVIVRGPERSLWQKLKGAPANRLAGTTWTLVGYDLPETEGGEA